MFSVHLVLSNPQILSIFEKALNILHSCHFLAIDYFSNILYKNFKYMQKVERLVYNKFPCMHHLASSYQFTANNTSSKPLPIVPTKPFEINPDIVSFIYKYFSVYLSKSVILQIS